MLPCVFTIYFLFFLADLNTITMLSLHHRGFEHSVFEDVVDGSHESGPWKFLRVLQQRSRVGSCFSSTIESLRGISTNSRPSSGMTRMLVLTCNNEGWAVVKERTAESKRQMRQPCNGADDLQKTRMPVHYQRRTSQQPFSILQSLTTRNLTDNSDHELARTCQNALRKTCLTGEEYFLHQRPMKTRRESEPQIINPRLQLLKYSFACFFGHPIFLSLSTWDVELWGI